MDANRLRWWIPLAFALVAIAGLTLLWSFRNRGFSPDTVNPYAHEGAGGTRDSQASVPDIKTNTSTASASRISNLLADYRCQQAPCDHDPFSADSELEAAWLKRNGFPSHKQRTEAQGASTLELRRKAKAGSLSDIALYGERLAQEGDWAQSVGELGSAANKGSIYALYAISDVYATWPNHVAPLQSKAFLRAAYLAGDSKASGRLWERFPDFDSAMENAWVDKEGVRIHGNVMKYKVSPRPRSSGT